MTIIFKRFLRNTRDEFHHNSSYWQEYRDGLPMLAPLLMRVAVAMVLSDAGLGIKGADASMKIEQGYKQIDFVYHLFDMFKDYLLCY